MISEKLSKKALTEAYEILKLLDDESLEKIPEKLLNAMEISREEAYGAVINYAIGNGNYSNALGNQSGFSKKSKEDIVTEVTEDTLAKVVIKYQKKALKRARACVSKETVAKKDETLGKLNGLVAEVEAQSVAPKQ